MARAQGWSSKDRGFPAPQPPATQVRSRTEGRGQARLTAAKFCSLSILS